MLKISKKIEYTLIILQYMKDKEELTTAKEICERFHTPFDTTSKILQTLNQKKILTSIQGIHGGYRLIGDLYKLSYLRLAEIVENKPFTKGCSTTACAMFASCNISGPVTKLGNYLTDFFDTLSVADLLNNGPFPTKEERK